MKKLIYLGLLILDISNIVIYDYWFEYAKLKYGKNAKLGYKYNQFHAKSKDDQEEFAEDIEAKFDTQNYEVNRTLPIGNNIKMISQINDKFGGRIMKEFVKPKMYQDDIWQIMSILEKNQKSQRRA